uniref:Protein kinase domain-containing protein n=1 Tax=Oryza glumipatula TaxID=40148 RepID=A0A0D9YLS0_9ORYZ
MDDLPDDQGQSDAHPSDPNWWSSHAEHKLGSISLTKQERNSGSPGSSHCGEGDHSLWAAQTLWCTGCLSSPIPNGFYSIIPDKKLKERFDTIPSPDDLYSLGIEGFKAEIILVDLEKDKKLSAIKQLCAALVKGLKSNPAAMIKKIAGLVSDFYKRPNPQLSPARTSSEEISHFMENRGVQLLGQIRHGSCRPRAILFKVLADAVGMDCKLLVGIPNEEYHEYDDSSKHMSVVVMLKSVEFLVDLMRFPGQLVPFSSKAIITSHISAAGESDSADYDSCDSPLEPNSPLCSQRQEQDDNNRSFKVPSLRNIMLKSTNSMEGKLRCSSHSEPNVANSFCGRSRRKVVEEHQRTASSSPEHPLSRTRGRSMLGDRQHGDGVAVSRSDGASTSNIRRGRRRSISFTPEIGDDIVSAVRAMSERMRENRLSRGQNDGSPGQLNDSQKNESPDDFNDNEVHVRGPDEQEGSRRQVSNQKAVSLPSSPHRLRSDGSGLRGPAEFLTADLMSTWNKVLRSSPFLNKPLLPFEEWHIEFSEITVGTRVGIGFFGEVFRGIWNGTDVAIKLFLEQDLTTENMEDFCNEISILRGLMCMHRLKIVHRDLKSANCLVNKHWAVKLCDFGLSRVMSNSAMNDNSSAGTPEWMAPELIRNEPFTEKCDIFSLGVIMWELCTLSRPWEGIPSVQVVYNVANEGARLEIPDGPLGSLIADCWAEPDKRPGCQEILTRLLDCEYTLC